MRTQQDGLNDIISLATADPGGGNDMCRPEFGPDADIINIAAKFNIAELQRPITWGGELDFTQDLQNTLTAITESKQAYNRLHPDLRDKYPRWQDFVNAMADGSLSKELDKLGLSNVSVQQVTEIDDQLAREERRAARIRERQAATVAEQIKSGTYVPPQTEEKPKK